jgi:hypothetical protein
MLILGTKHPLHNPHFLLNDLALGKLVVKYELDQVAQPETVGVVDLAAHEETDAAVEVDVVHLYTLVLNDKDVQGGHSRPEGAPRKSTVVADFDQPIDQSGAVYPDLD